MARRGSKKALSIAHENFVAKAYGGRRSPSSGAAEHDQGDVRAAADGTLLECKYKGSPAEPLKSKPSILTVMEKVADEAWSESKEPAIALRFFWPDSPLANRDGWVDLTVRLTNDDAVRSDLILHKGQNGN